MDDHDELIERAREAIAVATRVVAFSGAGLSAESGIPTFRDAAGNALWQNYDPMRLASAEGFDADPRTVIAWYAWRRGLVASAQPNAAHRALAARPDILNVTQNVDNLLERAGCASDNVVRLHGRIDADRCHGLCGHEEWIDPTNPPGVRACPRCGERMRPAVVWFGESLPGEGWKRAMEACASAEVLLVIGTSATVYPAAGLIEVASRAGARVVVINAAASAASDAADIELIGPAGAILPTILQKHAAMR